MTNKTNSVFDKQNYNKPKRTRNKKYGPKDKHVKKSVGQGR